MIDKNDIYLSISNIKEEECINISILKGKFNLDKIEFDFLFNPSDCIKKRKMLMVNFNQFKVVVL